MHTINIEVALKRIEKRVGLLQTKRVACIRFLLYNIKEHTFHMQVFRERNRLDTRRKQE